MPHSIYSNEAMADHGAESANRLHLALEDVIAKWERLVRSQLAAAADKSHEELIDSITFFLHGLIEALSVNGEDIETGEAAHVFRKHGEQRAKLEGFTVRQVIMEYSILREVVFEVLEAGNGLSRREREIINRAVDFGMRECVSEFLQSRISHYKSRCLAYEEQQHRDHSVLSSIQDPFVSIDFESRFAFVNEAALALFGRSREELLGKSITDIVSTEASDKFLAICEAALESHGPAFIDFCNEDGCVVYRVHAYPYKEGFSLLFLNSTEAAASIGGIMKDFSLWLAPREHH